MVDGVPVARVQLDRTLEGIYGAQILPRLIDSQLLANALAARGQSVSDGEVDGELTRIQEQDPSVKTAVEAGGIRLEVIKDQVRRNLTMQKLLTSRVAAPTEGQLRAFFNTYTSYYGTPTQNELGLLVASTKTRADQMVRALKANPAAFDALVKEQKGKAATDPIGAQSTSNVGRFETPDEFATSRGIPPQIVAPLIKLLATAKKGQILPVQALVPTGPFLIVKVVDRKEASKPDLASLHSQVETDYKMAQVAQAEIKKNPQNPHSLEQNIKQLLAYMAQANPQTGEPGVKGSLRDALATILRSAEDNSLNYLRAHSKVAITEPSFMGVASQYGKTP